MTQEIATSLALPTPDKALVFESIVADSYAQVQAVLARLFGRLPASLMGYVAQDDGVGNVVPWQTTSIVPTSINDNTGLHLHDFQGASIFNRKVGVDGTKRMAVLVSHLYGCTLDIQLRPWTGASLPMAISVSNPTDAWSWVAQVVIFTESQTEDVSGPIPMQVDAKGTRTGTDAMIAQWHLFEDFLTDVGDMPI